MTIALFILALALIYALFLVAARYTPDEIFTTIREDAKAVIPSLKALVPSLKAGLGWLLAVALYALAWILWAMAVSRAWLWSRHPGRRMRRFSLRRNRRAGRHVAAVADPCDANRPDHDDITEAEHEQAVAHAIRKFGKLPASLERVIGIGGRIGLPQRKQEAQV